MSIDTFSNLLKPIKIGNTMFRNRIFSSPTGPTDVSADGAPSNEILAYFERKAVGGAASICVGECVVDRERGVRGRRHTDLTNFRAIPILSRLASSISRNGAVATIELQHSGIFAHALIPGSTAPVYGPSEMEVNGRIVTPMSEDLILETVRLFAESARIAKDCGFGMVTVHAAHGWLLQQFLSPSINKRTDKWGGSFENRARFAVAVADEIHRVCGKNFPVEMRISGTEVVPEGYGIEEAIEIAKQLDGHVDLIHVSVGNVGSSDEGFVNTHPSMFKEHGLNVKYAAEIKKHVRDSYVATVGALSDPYVMEEIIASGKADVVELARGLICDPDIPTKLRDGREDEIRKCMRCFACFSNCMKKGAFLCSLNPEVSRELEVQANLPPVKKQRVLVAGGGIAGMQFALEAANNGHEVILCEKTGSLGGAIRCEKDVPFKENLEKYINLQERLIAKNPAIELRLNTTVTPEYARAQNVDVIAAALGARPVKPQIPGIDNSNVLGAIEAYSNPNKAGSKVLIIGAGLVGTELSVYLAQLGHKVEIIEMSSAMGDSNNSLHVRAVKVELNRYNIPVHYNIKAVAVESDALLCEGPDGKIRFLADTIIYATGMQALHNEAAEFYDCAKYFFQIGDCSTPSNILEANAAAYTMARHLGRY